TKGEAVNGIAEFDFKLDLRGDPVTPKRFLLEPDKFYLADRDRDYALVAVSPTSTDAQPLGNYGYHRLIADENKIEEGEWITIIQHPGGRRRQFSIRE